MTYPADAALHAAVHATWWRRSPFHSERRKNSVTGSDQHRSWNIWSICSRPWNEAFTIDALSLFSQIFDTFERIEIFRVGRKASVTFYRLKWDWGITMGTCSQNCVDTIGNVHSDECQSTIFVWWRDHGFDVFHIVDFVFFGSRFGTSRKYRMLVLFMTFVKNCGDGSIVTCVEDYVMCV